MTGLEGFIYAVRCNEFVKIGWASNPRKRLNGIKSSLPYRCEMIGIRPAKLRDEQKLHAILRPYRIRRGEWYRYEGVLLDVIETLRLTPIDQRDKRYGKKTPEQRANQSIKTRATLIASAQSMRRKVWENSPNKGDWLP